MSGPAASGTAATERARTVPTRTLGLDLAKTTGLVVVRPDRSIVWKTTFTTHAANEAGQCLEIRDLVDKAIREYGPFAVVGIEDTWLGRNVGLLKHLARLSGAVLVALSDHDQPYLFVPPNRARKSLRLPYHPKAEVHRVLRARRSVPRDLGADELDAWVVAVAAYRFARRNGLLNGKAVARG